MTPPWQIETTLKFLSQKTVWESCLLKTKERKPDHSSISFSFPERWVTLQTSNQHTRIHVAVVHVCVCVCSRASFHISPETNKHVTTTVKMKRMTKMIRRIKVEEDGEKKDEKRKKRNCEISPESLYLSNPTAAIATEVDTTFSLY